jgi:WD40 repeat protein
MEENLIPVNAVLLSKDDYVISTSPDGKVKLWDLHTGGLLRSIAVHTKEVTSLALTQDGLLVTGSADKTIGIVDLASGHVLRVLEGHADRVNSVAITGDGRVVSGSADKSIKIWDLETGRILRTIESALQLKNLLTGHTRSVNCIVVTEDGWIVSGSDDPKYNMIKIWDLESGWLLADLNGHTDGVVTLAVTNDRRILSCSKDSTIGVWDLSNASKPSIDERASLAQGLPTSILRGHTQSVNAVMLVAENRLISASEDKTIKLWDLETGKFQDLFGADASIRTLSLSWDNRWLVCGDAQGRMRRFEFVYSEDNRSLERGWREPDVSVAASPKPISKDFCAMAVVILAVRIVDVMGLPILIGWQQRSWTAFAAGLMITFLGVGLSLFGLSNIDHPAGRLVARGTTTLIVLLWGWLGWQLGSATPIRCLAPALCGIAVLLSFAIHVLWYTQAVAASKLSRETGSAK